MTQKLQLYLSEDAAEIIRQSTTERKRGEWLSNVVVDKSMPKSPPISPVFIVKKRIFLLVIVFANPNLIFPPLFKVLE